MGYNKIQMDDENFIKSKVLYGKKIFGIGNLDIAKTNDKEVNIYIAKDSKLNPIGYY